MEVQPTKIRLLDAAAVVFLEHGFAAASMDMVRQQAGVSNGSLYHHYPSKAQLAQALYAHTLRDFHAVVLAPITARATARSGVTGIIRAYIEWVIAHPERARLLHEMRRSGAVERSGEVGDANADALGTLRSWIAQRVEVGDMRDLPFGVWMAVVFAPALALTGRWVTQPTPTVAPKERAALEHAAWMAVAA